MTLAHWLPFAIASAILVAIPGPTVLLVISYALGHGRRFALVTTAGVALGDLTSMTASNARARRDPRGIRCAVHGAQMARRGLSDLSWHQAVARADAGTG